MIPSAEYDLIDSIGTSGFLIRLLSVLGVIEQSVKVLHITNWINLYN
jgi:hypothetical protein